MITRCICHSRTFEEIKTVAKNENMNSLEDLQDEDICGCGCGLCIPYVEMMLETGDTEFEYGAFYDSKG